METIDDILKEEPKAEEPEAIIDPPSDIVDPPSDRLRDDKGRFVKKDETGVQQQEAPPPAAAEPAPPAGSQLPKDVYEPLKAVREENRLLKDRLASLERAVSSPPSPQQPPADFWDDPQAFMDARLNQLGETLLQNWEQRDRKSVV